MVELVLLIADRIKKKGKGKKKETALAMHKKLTIRRINELRWGW